VSHGGKVLVVYGSGHLWHREGGITSALDRLTPGRTFVAEVFAPVGRQPRGREAQEFDESLKALEDTVSARALLANPFYLGQAMLDPSTTLGDLDDAGVYFGR
jgi:hypothetical protein